MSRNSGPCLCGDPECPRCFVQTTICGKCEREWPTNTGMQVCPECGNDGDIEGHVVREDDAERAAVDREFAGDHGYYNPKETK